MRERTTWNKSEIAQRTAAIEKKADPYAMNQDHLKQQPPADKYLTGDPSSFAEDIHPNDWSSEYSGGQVKRNEIGMPEMRSETFNHPEKTASVNEAVLVKKADLCTKVARLMAKGKRFASHEAAEQWVEDQAVPLMNLPDTDLINTFQRLADDQQAPPVQAGEQQQTQAGQQQQQAPMAAQEQQAADEQMKQLAEQAVQAIQSGDQEQAKQVVQAMVKQARTVLARRANDQGMQQQAQGQQQAPVQAQQQQAPVQAQGQPQGQQAQQQQAPVQAQGQPQGQPQGQQAGQQQQAQQQSVDDQVAQMVQQAIQSQQTCGPKMANAPQAPVAAPAPVAAVAPALAAAPAPQGTSVQANDDALLDQMLMGPAAAPAMAETDIQLDPAPMDVGEVSLGPEDDVLRTLFANQEAQDAEEAQQAQQGGDQQKQAHAVRTAATRTVGTRPTAGVARIGGAGTPPAKGPEEVNRLAGLWQSAPDVRDAFGLR